MRSIFLVLFTALIVGCAHKQNTTELLDLVPIATVDEFVQTMVQNVASLDSSDIDLITKIQNVIASGDIQELQPVVKHADELNSIHDETHRFFWIATVSVAYTYKEHTSCFFRDLFLARITLGDKSDQNSLYRYFISADKYLMKYYPAIYTCASNTENK